MVILVYIKIIAVGDKMTLNIKSKEEILKFFTEELGYDNNPYFNYDKSKVNLDNVEEIRNNHLISDTSDFKIWLFEMEDIKTDVMNKIANKLYNGNPFEYNLLIFTDLNYNELTFLHYYKEEKEKLKIRRLNIEDSRFTRTDLDILYLISIKNKKIIDDLDIELEYRKAFNLEEVTKKFFAEFKREIDNIEKNIIGFKDKQDKRNYAVLLASRMVFLYFIQKKKWLNGKKDFLYDRYKYCINSKTQLNYFKEILEPLFFDCLNTPMDTGMLKNRNERAKKLYEDFKSQTDVICDPQYYGIPYLNGGLFDRHPKYEINTEISINNEVFKEIFDNLLEKYNFTVREDLGYDADVAVDPELLGRIFENMINSEERKTTGSFYTPRAIISYMCKQSLKEYLKEKCKCANLEKIEYLIENLEDDDLYSKEKSIVLDNGKIQKKDCSKYKVTKEESYEIIHLLHKITICDPAVGSGAFILGMLQLLAILKKKLYYYGLSKKIDLYELKKEIIKNNLYGVDIQESATEIAHLRLWLSLAVEYNVTSISNIKPLPNLAYKIIQGNSLISEFEGIDFDEEINKIKCDIHQVSLFSLNYQEFFSNIILAKQQYFSATSDKTYIKGKIYKAEFNLIKEILKLDGEYRNNEQIDDIMLNNKEQCFSWFLNFSEIFVGKGNKDAGFDIIIGNPPYIQERENKHVFDLIKKGKISKQYFEGKMNYWYYFLYRGLQLLKPNGYITYIAPNYFTTSSGAKKLNNKIIKETQIINYIDFNKTKVFQDADTQCMIFLLKNKKPSTNARSNIYLLREKVNNRDLSVLMSTIEDCPKIDKFNIPNQAKLLNRDKINFEYVKYQDILKKIESKKSKEPLFKSSQGIIESPDKISSSIYNKIIINNKEVEDNYYIGQGVFVLFKEELEDLNLSTNEIKIIREYHHSKHISRYSYIRSTDQYLIYADSFNKNLISQDVRYKNIKNHLDKFKLFITSSNKPYGLHRPRTESIFKSPKILFPQMCKYPQFAFCEEDYYVGMSTNIINSLDKNIDLLVFTGILNSKLAHFWLLHNAKNRGVGIDIGVSVIDQFPVNKLLLKNKKISELVNQIVSFKAKSVDTVDIEKILDDKVYDIYGINEQERNAIEKYIEERVK